MLTTTLLPEFGQYGIGVAVGGGALRDRKELEAEPYNDGRRAEIVYVGPVTKPDSKEVIDVILPSQSGFDFNEFAFNADHLNQEFRSRLLQELADKLSGLVAFEIEKSLLMKIKAQVEDDFLLFLTVDE